MQYRGADVLRDSLAALHAHQRPEQATALLEHHETSSCHVQVANNFAKQGIGEGVESQK